MRLGAGVLAICVGLAAGGASAEQQFEWLRLDRRHVKRGVPAAATGPVATYAQVSEPIHLDDARNCRDVRPRPVQGRLPRVC